MGHYADEYAAREHAERRVTIRADELARLRAIEAAARKMLTLDVPDPVARAIALAIIASGLRDLIAPGPVIRLVDPEPTAEELRRAAALAGRLGR